MAGKTTFLSNKILDHALRNTAYTPPATVYLGLFSVAPTDAGGGTELTGNAYARQAISFSAAAGSATSNSAAIDFPVATPGAWSAAVAFGIFDAPTGGNLLYWGTLTSVTIAANEFLRIPAGDLDVTDD